MSFNESTVENAALSWFGELGYAVGHGPQITPDEQAAERGSFGEVVLVGRLREAIRRLNPTIDQSCTLATLRDALLPKLLSGALRMQDAARYAERTMKTVEITRITQ